MSESTEQLLLCPIRRNRIFMYCDVGRNSERKQPWPILEDIDSVNSLQEPRKRLKNVSQDNKSAY
jgi:hypothetical protein